MIFLDFVSFLHVGFASFLHGGFASFLHGGFASFLHGRKGCGEIGPHISFAHTRKGLRMRIRIIIRYEKVCKDTEKTGMGEGKRAIYSRKSSGGWIFCTKRLICKVEMAM